MTCHIKAPPILDSLMVIIGGIRASRIPATAGAGKTSSEKEMPELITT